MSEEMEKLFWELKQYLVQHSPNWNTLCEIEQYISNLEQENKELKEQLKGTTHCYDEEEHKELSKKLLNKTTINITLKKDRDYWQGIVKEFEKWLNEETERKLTIIENIRGNIEQFKNLDAQMFALDCCAQKLYKLKGLNNV